MSLVRVPDIVLDGALKDEEAFYLVSGN